MKCWKCDVEIFFSPEWVTKNGKNIPLIKNSLGYKPHECPMGPCSAKGKKKWYRQRKFLAEWL